MNQGENKEFFGYDKSKKYSDWSDKTLRTYKDREKIEEKKGIISTFENETKIDAKTELEVHGNCGIMSTFKVKKKKNIELRKMKGMNSNLTETKKNNIGEHKQFCHKYIYCYVKYGGN